MRMVLLVAALVALAGSARAEEVLYCTVTASTGFIWDEGQTEGKRTVFTETRYIVKVLSEEMRTVTQTTGGIARGIDKLICRKPYPSVKPELLLCAAKSGLSPWLFEGSYFVSAYMFGPQFGGDPNIWVSYGTCTGF